MEPHHARLSSMMPSEIGQRCVPAQGVGQGGGVAGARGAARAIACSVTRACRVVVHELHRRSASVPVLGLA